LEINKLISAIFRYYKDFNDENIINPNVIVKEYRYKNNTKRYDILNNDTKNKLYTRISEKRKDDLLKSFTQYFSSYSKNDIDYNVRKICVIAIDNFCTKLLNDIDKRSSIVVLPIDYMNEISIIKENIANRSDMIFFKMENMDRIFMEFPYYLYHIGLLDKISASRMYQKDGFKKIRDN